MTILRKIYILIGLCLLMGPLCGFASTREGKDKACKWGFVENQGQWPEIALFRGNASGFSVRFEKDGVAFMSSRESDSDRIGEKHHEAKKLEEREAFEEDEEEIEYYVWKMHFAGGKPSPIVEKGNVVAARTNFFLGSDSSKWRTQVPEYDEIIYKEVWPGIDVRFLLSGEGALKYEFLLAPGADHEDIQVEFEGLDGLEVSLNGQLQLGHPWGPVIEDVPIAFTEKNREEVSVSFLKKGNSSYRF